MTECAIVSLYLLCEMHKCRLYEVGGPQKIELRSLHYENVTARRIPVNSGINFPMTYRMISEGKVVKRMVEETIRSIRETEQKADIVIKEANEKKEQIMKEAQTAADELRRKLLEEATGNARRQGEEDQETAQGIERQAAKGLEEEIRALRKAAQEKRKEAVELVIKELI